MLKTIDNVLLVDRSIMAELSPRVTNRYLHLVDLAAEHLTTNVDNLKFSGHNFALGFKTNANHSRSVRIYASKSVARNKVDIDFGEILFDDSNAVRATLNIPESVYEESHVGAGEPMKIISHTFSHDVFVRAPKSKGDIQSFITSASLKDIEVKNLTRPIEIVFKLNQEITEERNASCVYWGIGKKRRNNYERE